MFDRPYPLLFVIYTTGMSQLKITLSGIEPATQNIATKFTYVTVYFASKVETMPCTGPEGSIR